MVRQKIKTLISNPDLKIINQDVTDLELEDLVAKKKHLLQEIHNLESKCARVQKDIKEYEARKRKSLLRKLQYERSIIQEIKAEKKKVADQLFKMKGRLYKLRGFLYLRDAFRH